MPLGCHAKRVLSLLAVLSVGVACTGDDNAESRHLALTLYPGSLQRFEIDFPDQTTWQATAGKVTVDDNAAIFIAPVQTGTGSLVARNANDNEPLLTVDFQVPETVGPLNAEIDPTAQRVAGRFGQVFFEAVASGDEQASARYWTENQEFEVTVKIQSREHGQIHWDGIVVEGYGFIEEDALKAIREMASSPLGGTVSLAPLDLACQPKVDQLDPAIGAALLMPWQAILKYLTPGRAEVIRHFSDQSSCTYFPGVFDERDTGRVPFPGMVSLSNETPIPMAYGYFPFDGEGQLEVP